MHIHMGEGNWKRNWTNEHRGMTLGAFGGVAGFFALFFFTDIPRVRKDIVTKIPIIGQHYVKEVPPSDNVGCSFFFL